LFVGDGARHGVWGSDSVDAAKMHAVALELGVRPVNEGPLEPLDAIDRFGTCATRELEILSGKPLPALETELWEAARDGKLKPVRALIGTLWEPA
jgi:hypothetical protein